MKNFVKAMDKTQSVPVENFQSEAKIKEGIFVGPQIHELLRDDGISSRRHGKHADF